MILLDANCQRGCKVIILSHQTVNPGHVRPGSGFRVRGRRSDGHGQGIAQHRFCPILFGERSTQYDQGKLIHLNIRAVTCASIPHSSPQHNA
jgi:hypothetical protein